MYKRMTIKTPKMGESDKRRKGQTEQSQKQQIDPITVEVIQQIASDGTEQDGRDRHGGQHDPDFGTGDANLFAVDRDNGNACKQKVKQKLSEICRCREGEKQQHKKAAASASA